MTPHQSEQFLLSWAKLGRKEYMADPNQCSVYLKRLQFFLDLIGNPEKKISHYIHVAGTSGKGSVCLMLDSILRTDGRRVGTMTSPEIGPTQTRWQINGKVMSKTEFAEILTALKPKLEKYLQTSPYDPISHFELMTTIGLYWFAKKKVNWAILEAGCGGRYDSTNIIPYKNIAVITNIALDHTEILGKTKEKIAYEKAGIIKKNCLVFTGESDKKVLKIIKAECNKQRASLKIFNYKNISYKLPVIGQHQIKNAILAIEIAEALKIPGAKIKSGLAKVKLPLRMEVISKKPLIILDGAHNPDKMKTTTYELRKITKLRTTNKTTDHSTIKPFNHLHLLVGFSADKNINQMIKQLVSLKPASVAITKFNNPFKKSAEPEYIKRLFDKNLTKTKIKTFSNPNDAFNWSKKQLKTGDILLVTGSMYLAGEIKKLTLL